MRLLARLLLLIIGLAIAIPFGALALTIGIVLEPTARELVGTLGFATVHSIFADLSSGYPPDERAVALITALGTGLFALLVAPSTFVALVGEVIGVRALLWYAGGAGIVTALLPWLGRARVGRFADAALQAEGRITALLFLTGAVTGLVYWAIAGRSAGRRRVPFAPAPSAGRA
jgi:hypothetical protein